MMQVVSKAFRNPNLFSERISSLRQLGAKNDKTSADDDLYSSAPKAKAKDKVPSSNSSYPKV
jgi:hypothetical protein